MKKLFNVALKVMGIWFIVSGVMSGIALIFVRFPSTPGIESDPIHYIWAARLSAVLVPIAVGFFLSFFTSEIEKMVDAPELELNGMSPASLLPVGISLIGLWYSVSFSRYIISRFPEYFSHLSNFRKEINLGDVVCLIFALYLTFRPVSVAQRIEILKGKSAS